MARQIIRIERGYAGYYLYKLMNRKEFDNAWQLSYWTLDANYIMNWLRENKRLGDDLPI